MLKRVESALMFVVAALAAAIVFAVMLEASFPVLYAFTK